MCFLPCPSLSLSLPIFSTLSSLSHSSFSVLSHRPSWNLSFLAVGVSVQMFWIWISPPYLGERCSWARGCFVFVYVSSFQVSLVERTWFRSVWCNLKLLNILTDLYSLYSLYLQCCHDFPHWSLCPGRGIPPMLLFLGFLFFPFYGVFREFFYLNWGSVGKGCHKLYRLWSPFRQIS